MTGDIVDVLAAAMRVSHGLILVCAPTGQGKTTTVLRAAGRCADAGSIVIMGDIRERATAFAAVELAAAGKLVVATIRVPSEAAGFARLIDMGVNAARLAEVSLASFGMRLLAGTGDRVAVFDELSVTDAIRAWIRAGARSATLESALYATLTAE
jgi:type II secretory ATPase GspE/PulE/Tfp pilus assembly ATPase PilB-like protein